MKNFFIEFKKIWVYFIFFITKLGLINFCDFILIHLLCFSGKANTKGWRGIMCLGNSSNSTLVLPSSGTGESSSFSIQLLISWISCKTERAALDKDRDPPLFEVGFWINKSQTLWSKWLFLTHLQKQTLKKEISFG